MADCRTLSELIYELNDLKAKHGDIAVADSYDNAISPEVDSAGTDQAVVVICDKA